MKKAISRSRQMTHNSLNEIKIFEILKFLLKAAQKSKKIIEKLQRNLKIN